MEFFRTDTIPKAMPWIKVMTSNDVLRELIVSFQDFICILFAYIFSRIIMMVPISYYKVANGTRQAIAMVN